MDINQIRECPDCASNNIVHNLQKEQVICRECGLIFEPLVPAVEAAFERSHKIGKPASKPTKSKVKAKPKKKKK